MPKKASPDHPVHELITSRWSPYAFADRDVAEDDLLSLFEAARWAPSSYNEQPWRYVVARRRDTDSYSRVLSCLVEGNQAWARAAPVLALGIFRRDFARNGEPNRAAVHDLGLAAGNLTLEATARGLFVHQMIGIVPDRAREVFTIPPEFEALSGLAIGYRGDPESLPEKLRERDRSERSRRPLAEFVFGDRFGETAGFVRS